MAQTEHSRAELPSKRASGCHKMLRNRRMQCHDMHICLYCYKVCCWMRHTVPTLGRPSAGPRYKGRLGPRVLPLLDMSPAKSIALHCKLNAANATHSTDESTRHMLVHPYTDTPGMTVCRLSSLRLLRPGHRISDQEDVEEVLVDLQALRLLHLLGEPLHLLPVAHMSMRPGQANIGDDVWSHTPGLHHVEHRLRPHCVRTPSTSIDHTSVDHHVPLDTRSLHLGQMLTGSHDIASLGTGIDQDAEGARTRANSMLHHDIVPMSSLLKGSNPGTCIHHCTESDHIRPDVRLNHHSLHPHLCTVDLPGLTARIDHGGVGGYPRDDTASGELRHPLLRPLHVTEPCIGINQGVVADDVRRHPCGEHLAQ